MGPLILRQYGQRCARLAPHLRRNLLWRYCAVGRLPPLVASFRLCPPVGAHTGALGWGHIAAVFGSPYRLATSLRLPAWVATSPSARRGVCNLFAQAVSGFSNGVHCERMGRCVATVLYRGH